MTFNYKRCNITDDGISRDSASEIAHKSEIATLLTHHELTDSVRRLFELEKERERCGGAEAIDVSGQVSF